MKRIKVVYEKLDGHTHMAIFSGPVDGQLGKAGDLCMTNEEFEEWENGSIKLAFVEREPITGVR
jgi:hypothetical protein